MNILFICKWNRFRSKCAEAIFNKFNETSKHEARSAGIIGDHPISKILRDNVKRFDIEIKGKPNHIDIGLLRWMDILVIVADDVPSSLFVDDNKNHGKKTLVWKIKDTTEDNVTEIGDIIEDLGNRIKQLLKTLH